MFRIVIGVICLLAASPATATEAAWALLREGGQVVLLRHAAATGTTDPANFDIDDCSKQRNLSDRGRQQARKIGSLFAARAAPIERVLSSRYCRALDTARIAFGSAPEPLEALDLLKDPADATARNAAVLEAIRNFGGSGTLVLVTHLENIMALTGAGAREGEAVVVAPEGETLHVLGRIVFN